MDYRREIDGLRAIAVLPVILFHAGYAGFSGGFVGVDIFFVISGYLITTIIITELDAGTFSLAGFYERRARRILPALFTVMLASLVFAWLYMMPADLKRFGHSLAAVAVFGSNFLFWQTQGYFGSQAELEPLLHTWSLAVEEQYYLLFPVLLMLCWRAGRRPVLILLALLATLSLGLAQWASGYHPGAGFYLLPMRGWELLLGAFAAFHLRGRVRGAWTAGAELGAGLDAVLIVAAIVAFDQHTPFPGLLALVPTLGSVLVILYATPDTWTGRMLGSRALVGIGLISYSSYLWHQPLLAFARQRYLNQLEEPLPALMVVASLGLGYLTYRLVERAFRDRQRFTPAQIVRYSVVGSLFFIAAGALLDFRDGYGGYYHSTLSEAQQRKSALIAAHTGEDMYDFMVDDGACRFWGRTLTPAIETRFDACAKRYGKALIVVGDSHAMNLYNVMAKAKVAAFIVGMSQGNCRIDTSKPICEYAAFEDFLRRQGRHISVLAYHQTGSPLLQDIGGDAFSADKFSGKRPLTIDRAKIDMMLHSLARPGAPFRSVWVGPWAEAHVPLGDILMRQSTMNPVSVAAFRQLDQAIGDAVSAMPANAGVAYVSTVQAFMPAGQALWAGDCLLFRDNDHLSRCGEDALAKWDNTALWAAITGP